MKKGNRVICIKSGHDEVGNTSIPYTRGDSARIIDLIWNDHFLVLNHDKRETKKNLKIVDMEGNGTGADIRKWRKL